MADKVWKAFERQVAKYFGTTRTGPMQPKGENDIKHDLIHVQCKYRKSYAILNMWREARKYAKGLIPILAIKDKGGHGFWLLIHSGDLDSIINQRDRVRKSTQ